jgi:hypothetical protein
MLAEVTLQKKEEHHRDSFHYALLGNSHPSLREAKLEVQITKVRKMRDF